MTDDSMGIVVDNGSGTMKIGWSGDDAPRDIEQTVIGEYQCVTNGLNTKGMYIGEMTYHKDNIESIQRPIERGRIVNWEMIQNLYYHLFYNRMYALPYENIIHMIISSSNTLKDKEKLLELMFEYFNTPSMCLLSDLFCSLMASGRLNATVLCSGYGVTTSASYFDGYLLPNTTFITNCGGSDLTQYLIRLLGKTSNPLITTNEYSVFNDIKKHACYLAQNYYNTEPESLNNQIQYELPDGKKVTLGKVAYQCPESLYRQDFLNNEYLGIHEMIFNSISSSESIIQKDLLNNIVLSGGNTLFPDFQKRLKNEVKELVEYPSCVEVIQQPEQLFLPWIGGSIITSFSSIQNLMITKKCYEEEGTYFISNINGF